MQNIQEKINYIKNKGFLLKKESFILEYLDKIYMIKLSKYFINFKQNNTECFSEVIKYYLFDIELRNLNLGLLEHIENSLKVQMVKAIGNNYLNKDLYVEKYSFDSINFVREKLKYLREFDLDTKKQKGDFIDSKVLFDKLTFGELVKIFKTLKYEYKIQISLFYGIKNIHIFESWIFAFRYLSNLCNHGENIFNRKFIKTIEGKKISECFEIKRNNLFISYFTILSFFNKRLNINRLYEEKVFKKIYKYGIGFELFGQKKKPSIFGHYSEELEAWKVLVKPLYDFYIKNSNLNLGEKNKINIIQFLPYFPPHKGGLETVGEEIGKYWIKNNFGDFINIVTEFNQEKRILDNNFEKIVFENKIIGYKKYGYEVLVCPSLEIINNFPVYKIGDKKYKLIKKYLLNKIGNKNKDFKIITHTRFFLTSFIGGLFARKNNIKWIHIEHGSDYVKLSSKIKSYLSVIYDKTFGKWIFKKADKVLAISEACKNFINKEFVYREVDVFYRGLELKELDKKKEGNLKLVFIGRLVKLKGVEDLLSAYKKSGLKNELIIIGDGEEKEKLESISKGFNITFLGFKNRDFIIDFLSKNNLILINPSYQEGMPTTVIEALLTGTLVIASDVGGTSEISNKDDLILFKSGDKEELKEKLKYSFNNYEKLNGLSLELINERFNWENNILKLYNFLK